MNLVVTSKTSAGIVADNKTTYNDKEGYRINVIQTSTTLLMGDQRIQMCLYIYLDV